MILLEQSSEIYNNDLRAMIMAFFPGVKIVTELPEGEVGDFKVIAAFEENKSFISIENSENKFNKEINGSYLDKQAFRNKLKRAIYDLLCQFTKRELPWGDLTGVRPTKIATAKLLEGLEKEAVTDYYKEVYATSERKAELATDVAQREMQVTKNIDLKNDYCLYIGIPFCPSRCLYCSFTSYPIAAYREKSKEYLDKLKEELSYISDIMKNRRLVSIYVGGGTPTSITHEMLGDLLSHVRKQFDLSGLLEFTVEAGRPDSITAEKLRVMMENKVTRISINPQTMNDETLRIIGRAHTKEQTKEAFHMARQMGFDNINMDLIAGLPGENIDSMKYTLDSILELGPDSLTVHSLAIKRAANLKAAITDYESCINVDVDEMLNMVSDAAKKLNMMPYYLYRQKNIGGNLENVGYSRENIECLYNILIMEEMTDIIAAGAGASSKLVYHDENRVERIENCKSVDDYIGRFDEMMERKKILLEKVGRI